MTLSQCVQTNGRLWSSGYSEAFQHVSSGIKHRRRSWCKPPWECRRREKETYARSLCVLPWMSYRRLIMNPACVSYENSIVRPKQKTWPETLHSLKRTFERIEMMQPSRIVATSMEKEKYCQKKRCKVMRRLYPSSYGLCLMSLKTSLDLWLGKTFEPAGWSRSLIFKSRGRNYGSPTSP